MEQGVRERDAGGDRITMLQQSALQAQSSGTPVPQPVLQREMWARVKEFDDNDDKYHGMIQGIVQETDAANLNNAVLSNVDKKYAPEDGESETAVQDAVDEMDKNSVAESGKLDMADTVKRAVLLKGLAPIAEVQKHVMKYSARPNCRSDGSSSCGSRAPYAHGCRRSLHEWPEGKGQDERKWQVRRYERPGQAKGEVEKGKETRLDICVRTVRCTRTV